MKCVQEIVTKLYDPEVDLLGNAFICALRTQISEILFIFELFFFFFSIFAKQFSFHIELLSLLQQSQRATVGENNEN